jgi:hypothetical protein
MGTLRTTQGAGIAYTYQHRPTYHVVPLYHRVDSDELVLEAVDGRSCA